MLWWFISCRIWKRNKWFSLRSRRWLEERAWEEETARGEKSERASFLSRAGPQKLALFSTLRRLWLARPGWHDSCVTILPVKRFGILHFFQMVFVLFSPSPPNIILRLFSVQPSHNMEGGVFSENLKLQKTLSLGDILLAKTNYSCHFSHEFDYGNCYWANQFFPANKNN